MDTFFVEKGTVNLTDSDVDAIKSEVDQTRNNSTEKDVLEDITGGHFVKLRDGPCNDYASLETSSYVQLDRSCVGFPAQSLCEVGNSTVNKDNKCDNNVGEYDCIDRNRDIDIGAVEENDIVFNNDVDDEEPFEDVQLLEETLLQDKSDDYVLNSQFRQNSTFTCTTFKFQDYFFDTRNGSSQVLRNDQNSPSSPQKTSNILPGSMNISKRPKISTLNSGSSTAYNDVESCTYGRNCAKSPGLDYVVCPVCCKSIPNSNGVINQHIDECLNQPILSTLMPCENNPTRRTLQSTTKSSRNLFQL